MNSNRPVLLIVVLVVLAGAVAYFISQGGFGAGGDPPRAKSEVIHNEPTPEHPSNPNFGGGGGG